MNPNHTGQGAPFDETLPATEPRIASPQPAPVGDWAQKVKSAARECAELCCNEATWEHRVRLIIAKHFPQPSLPAPTQQQAEVGGEALGRIYEYGHFSVSRYPEATHFKIDALVVGVPNDQVAKLVSALPAKGPGPGREVGDLLSQSMSRLHELSKHLRWLADGQLDLPELKDEAMAYAESAEQQVDKIMHFFAPPPASQSNPREHKP